MRRELPKINNLIRRAPPGARGCLQGRAIAQYDSHLIFIAARGLSIATRMAIINNLHGVKQSLETRPSFLVNHMVGCARRADGGGTEAHLLLVCKLALNR